MASLDIIILVIVGVSGLYGLMRGFVREVFSFLIWLFAFVAALNFHPVAQGWLEQFDITASENMRIILGFLVIFIITFIIGNIIFKFARQLLEKSQLGFLDRLFGLLFGILRALVIIVLAMMIANLVLGFFNQKLADFEFWQASKAVPYFDELQAWTLSHIDFEHEISSEALKKQLGDSSDN